MYATDPEAQKAVHDALYPYRNRWVEREMQYRKRDLLSHATGEVLDINAETGNNVEYLDGQKATSLTAVERDPNFKPHLKQTMHDHGFPDGLIVGKDSLEYLRQQPTGSVQSVISTMCLSKTDHAEEILDEIKRVMRRDGRLYFVEYSSFPGTRDVQEWWSQLTRPLTGTVTHPLAEMLTAKFGSVYMEDWTESPGRRDPRANVAVLLDPREDSAPHYVSPSLPTLGTNFLDHNLRAGLTQAVGQAEAARLFPSEPPKGRARSQTLHPTKETLLQRNARGLVPWSMRPLVAGYALHPQCGVTQTNAERFAYAVGQGSPVKRVPTERSGWFGWLGF